MPSTRSSDDQECHSVSHNFPYSKSVCEPGTSTPGDSLAHFQGCLCPKSQVHPTMCHSAPGLRPQSLQAQGCQSRTLSHVDTKETTSQRGAARVFIWNPRWGGGRLEQGPGCRLRGWRWRAAGTVQGKWAMAERDSHAFSALLQAARVAASSIDHLPQAGSRQRPP